MRVCFFSGDITRSGGTENVGVMIANALAQRPDYSVSFISLFEENAQPFFAIDTSIKCFTVYAQPMHGIQHYFDTCKRLKSLLKANHIDVLIDIDGVLDMYSLAVRRSAKVKVISWEHFNYMQNPDVPYRKITRRWAARSADAIVTLTKADKHLYETNLKLRCPVVAIANPMAEPQAEPQYDLSSRLIISSGRLTYQKGFDLLVEVAARVLPQHPDWKWSILGEGEDRAMLEQKIKEAHLDSQLILEGRVDDMGAWYRRAALFVLTSRFEGLPMVLLEAKANRLPIVSFDCPTGPADIIRDGVNGDLIPEGDVESMAIKINVLIDNNQRRIDYAQASGLDEERFRLDAIMDSWESLMAKVVKERGHA